MINNIAIPPNEAEKLGYSSNEHRLKQEEAIL